MVNAGDRAPDFVGTTADGKRIGLSDFRGQKPLVLYFYPKDNTPTCTKEACSFRDHAGEIAAAGGEIIGVSNDGPEAHKKFIADHRLNFPLLSDTDGSIAKAFGVARLGGILSGWIPPRRVTFVIDREGVVRRVIESEFSAQKHIDGAIEALKALGAR